MFKQPRNQEYHTWGHIRSGQKYVEFTERPGRLEPLKHPMGNIHVIHAFLCSPNCLYCVKCAKSSTDMSNFTVYTTTSANTSLQ